MISLLYPILNLNINELQIFCGQFLNTPFQPPNKKNNTILPLFKIHIYNSITNID